MKIEVGKYYINECIDPNGYHEKNIMKVISEPNKFNICDVETMWIINGKIQDVYKNCHDNFRREATEDEIELYENYANDVKNFRYNTGM